MSTPVEQHHEALRDRRQGIMSPLDDSATWPEAKPDFYADSRVLSEDALTTFEGFKDLYPPYGLVAYDGKPYTGSSEQPWKMLYHSLRATGRAAVEKAEPSITECPYHQMLGRFGVLNPPLEPIDHDEHGIDTLRSVVTPGAVLNASLFISLVLRSPGIQTLHGSDADPEEFARNSVSLLREPMAHPQEWAEPFVYSLGSLTELVTSKFLNDELAAKYTKVEQTRNGGERLAWAIPTEDFTLRQEVYVLDRTKGSERDRTNQHRTYYPAGTRLGDIATYEPTLGCPGNKLANAMWQRVVDAVVGEELWQQIPQPRGRR